MKSFLVSFVINKSSSSRRKKAEELEEPKNWCQQSGSHLNTMSQLKPRIHHYLLLESPASVSVADADVRAANAAAANAAAANATAANAAAANAAAPANGCQNFFFQDRK